MSRIASTLAAALLACAAATPALAPAQTVPQGPGQSMLVLDASGSMWGQIGGKTKIEIAREAVGSMLATWPADQQLGLMAYGHRSKGDCADIQMLKAPGALDKASFQQAVNALQPKGMTPITASVRMAAEHLKFSEQKATVILVSDGEETCQADPCALGKELEKLGVDFTAHVVGFDIDKNPKAKAQLQCLASSTGGRYLDAKDAGELNKALREVAQVPAAPPPAEPEVCADFEAGQPFMPNTQIGADGQISAEGEGRHFEVVPMRVGQTAQECQKLCEGDSNCTVWSYEPTGSYFVDHPRCFRWDKHASFGKPEPAEGFAAGFREGTRQIRLSEGHACAPKR